MTDAWGEPSTGALSRAAAFRERVKAGRFDAGHLLESCEGSRRLLSVTRSDGWFVHVWLEGTTDVLGILTVVGG